ncbi:Sorting nexin lst-4 [Amphibalanus amphitrite]|uniref:Sorting nexin lst-4 n=1 Tax=Amphibalanus amphitrite TaxID=1232801 RepID=A0A6A4VFK9_AMPAM|nr:Sorting nexin lst-4 [Amphibalanus amphitrite]KAF0295218.1 Sorting nexin lst-4 [Amphibalanus amphitrite]
MSEFKATALYDFEPQPDTSEIRLRAGELLTITRTDVGEGWWEGVNESQQCGLFPEAYCERVAVSPPPPPVAPPAALPVAPPVVPPAAPGWSVPTPTATTPAASRNSWTDPWKEPTPADPWSTDREKMPPPAAPVPGGRPSSVTNADDWDDDWDDDSDADTQVGGPAGGGEAARHLAVRGSAGDVSNSGRGDGKATVKRNLNRFSTFVKSGGEDYILGVSKIHVSDADLITITETEHGYEWDSFTPYTCTVTSPKKETKMKGLKSFIAYQLVPSFSNIQVSRRYKHFDWLHDRLEEKFTLIPVAPLPDKQVTGRYEEDFIEHRMMMLQQWVNRICRHPVLSRCEVWNHFLTCTDEKQWKTGKRRAEKDELVGANFFMALKVPDKPLMQGQIETEIDNFSKFSQSMDAAVKLLQTISVDQIKKHQGPYKREFQKISHGFKALSQAFGSDTQAYSPALTQAVGHTAAVYQEGAMQKRKEYSRYGAEGKLSDDEVQQVGRRTDVVSYALMAEMSHFQKERVADFTEAMRGFLRNQVSFYRQIADKLEESLQTYENIQS